MGLITLPYSLTAHTDAKASEVMANLNKILGLVNGNIDGTNIAEGAVAKKQLATFFNWKRWNGQLDVEMAGGAVKTATQKVNHSLGEVPTHLSFAFATEVAITVALQANVTNLTATYFEFHVVPSGAWPGAFNVHVFWEAVGQP